MRITPLVSVVINVNRGMSVKTFETPEEAFAWLELTPPNKSDAGDTA